MQTFRLVDETRSIFFYDKLKIKIDVDTLFVTVINYKEIGHCRNGTVQIVLVQNKIVS
jgi:hypothetical protein